MAMRDIEITLKDRLLSLITSMGYEFVGCELQKQGRRSLLRIYIDKDVGINLDDCTSVSRQVSAMFDVDDPIQGMYTLEVSSPGLDRPLFEKAHYLKYVDSRIKVRIYTPIEDRRNFVGLLLRVDEESITLLVDDEEMLIPFSNIEKAKVIADTAG
jgi:ribosome maturation factor RimP